MTQTARGQKQKEVMQRRNRPGQRQQERLMREARRQKRRRIIISTITVVLLAIVIGVGIRQYQLYTTDQANAAAKLNSQHATATAIVKNGPPAVTGTPVTLKDGLQYIDIKQGTGPAAKQGSTVTVQYTGWLKSTKEKFASSSDPNGQLPPVTIGQKQVIPGWEEGLVGMKAGGTRRLIIPAALAYGAQGQPPVIPPNADLIFDITMESIK